MRQFYVQVQRTSYVYSLNKIHKELSSLPSVELGDEEVEDSVRDIWENLPFRFQFDTEINRPILAAAARSRVD